VESMNRNFTLWLDGTRRYGGLPLDCAQSSGSGEMSLNWADSARSEGFEPPTF
jgi:hypothetical protein